MNIFISEINIKNSGIENPIDKKVIAKIDADTIKIAFIMSVSYTHLRAHETS